MTQSFLVQSEIQHKRIKKFKTIEEQFKSYAEQNDIASRFPFENIEWLINEGYTLLTLPKAYGGEGATIEDMVILQTYLAEIDGATALSIGWHLSVVGQLFEQQLWEPELLELMQ